MSKPTDADLVRRLRAGDATAWDAIDRRHRPALERFARRMLRDVALDQVEDVVQEALWRAHRALHRDTRVLELRPWLYRLTRNCCLDENDICLGCHRSLTEICAWSSSSGNERREILARCKARAEERLRKPPAGPRGPW